MTMKTEMQIERDFYTFIKESSIGASIRGGLYRSEMRPANSVAEDAIVKFLAGYDAQIQSGIVLLHVYVPGIDIADGRKVADKVRIGELESLICDFVRDFDNAEYLIETDGTPYATINQDIEQHLIVARLKFQRISND
ncbi:MAG: hypothetical protein NC401_12195 [Ruminococcus sp.]|nr:hypothetical protein [Ruminococcus sp.]MCM1439022.1 hypothetical protein [Roseburia sp.]